MLSGPFPMKLSTSNILSHKLPDKATDLGSHRPFASAECRPLIWFMPTSSEQPRRTP
jgi:hypothetical protein